MLPSLVSLALAAVRLGVVRAQVSIYDYPIPLPHDDGPYDGWEAYDPTEIQDPPLPVPPPPLDFVIEVDRSGNPQAGIQTPGAFMGISIEMSLSEPIIGPNSSYLRPQFLNLMATVKERAGPPVLRMGGNSQEKAGLVDQLPGGASVAKFAIGPTGFTNTPTLSYTIDLIKALRAASDLLQIKWFVGIPMNTTDPPRLEIVEQGESVMGEYLWGWQLGNEPDLYVSHNYRTEDYTIESYLDEFEKVVNAITSNPKIKVSNNIGGPGVCCVWRLDDLIFQYNYFERFNHVLNSLIIQVRHKPAPDYSANISRSQHYPYDNCDRGRYDPQQKMNEYMQHNFALKFANGYQNAVRASLAAGLPVILLETNTASCNGFLGLSDAFSGALWGMDLGLTLAANNFTHMMLHLGGQAAWYNPFMSPPHNASAPFMWTVGPVMYTIVAMAEALGKTNTARVADLNANGGNDFTPAYMIYENNQPARVVLINYMSDPTGAHDYTARIATGGSQVWVRYMLAPYMASKRNITWAGQSFGHYFESDGILRGQHQTDIIPCTGGVCPVRVPAPSIALVFLTEPVFVPEDAEAMSETFMTSFTTKRYNTAAVPAAALQTSNGLNAEARKAMGKSSTSSGRWREEHGGARVLAPQFTLHLAAAVAGLVVQTGLRM